MCSSFGPLGKIDRTEKKRGMDLGDGVAGVDTLRRSAAHLLSLPRSLCSAGPVPSAACRRRGARSRRHQPPLLFHTPRRTGPGSFDSTPLWAPSTSSRDQGDRKRFRGQSLRAEISNDAIEYLPSRVSSSSRPQIPPVRRQAPFPSSSCLLPEQ
jgi:hypothetical protein